jgi:hypothetical protein
MRDLRNPTAELHSVGLHEILLGSGLDISREKKVGFPIS